MAHGIVAERQGGATDGEESGIVGAEAVEAHEGEYGEGENSQEAGEQ